VKGGLLLDVVVGEGAAVFELLSSEDQTLLVGGDTLLVYWKQSVDGQANWEVEYLRTLNLGLDIVNGVGRLHLKGDSLARKGLDEDLHLDEGL
jgi:hypothetical protein